MDIAVVLYVANVAFNTVIIAIDVAIIFVAIQTREIFEQLILWTIFLCMGTDIAVYLNTVIHDVPSFAMDTDVFKIPMFTPYCGFTYLVHSHYWYLDLSKPYSYLYQSLNLVLQTAVAVVVACADIVIIWKIRMLRIVAANKHTTTLPPRATVMLETVVNRKKRINREIRVAVNFVFLSVCFLIMTVVYNLPFRKGIWYDFLFKLTSNLNLSKWAIYTLENAKIREGFLSLCRRRLVEPLKPSSVITVTPAR
ncbi:unnamed protein product [Haemonchus placei]|uniref:G protein-coupled receptor n=1 Tax=Haemonchus placei TaxID=6290 RepID=A0A0N4W4R4_HAEPC|nr:unnamed protein product [Haemonchus placei]